MSLENRELATETPKGLKSTPREKLVSEQRLQLGSVGQNPDNFLEAILSKIQSPSPRLPGEVNF